MAFLDIILGVLLAYGLYKGLRNGLFVEIAAIVALIAGLYGAIRFSYIIGGYLSQKMDWSEQNINLAAFILTFIIIVILVHLAGKLLTQIADIAMLEILNILAGGVFGVLKMAVIIGAILIFFEKANASINIVKEETLQESILYTPIRNIGAFVFGKVIEAKNKKEEKEKAAEELSVSD